MITGIAVLGVLAGSLASLFNVEPASEPKQDAADAERSAQRSWPCYKPSYERSNAGSANSPRSSPLGTANPSSPQP